MIFAIDYASPSVFESGRDRALLGMSANARRPVRFHGQVTRNIPLFRFHDAGAGRGHLVKRYLGQRR